MAPRRPTSTGRKKIEIRRIESEEAQHVCFSKRRRGLFNKVSELSILCGVEVAAVVFSPGGRAFSCGHPSAESVIDRFISSNSSEELAEAAVDDGAGEPNLALAPELNQEHGELRAKLAANMAWMEAAKESLEKARVEGCQAAAWLDPVSQMGEEDLVAFEAALSKVRAHMVAEAQLFGRPVHGGGGKFELGGTSASGGMEMTPQQQQMMMMMMMLDMPPPPGFSAGTEMTQQQQLRMAMPPPTEFDAGKEMMQHQQQMMMMMAMPPTLAFARTEMMQQQQQMMMMAMPPTMGLAGTEIMHQQQPQKQQMMEMPPLPPPMGFDAATEMMQQQQMMMAMPPPPPLLGFSPGMETVHQGFGPHGFLQ
ncbi:hypothetical protein ACQ4PT_070382 [Festuca glaucescens]